MTEISASQAPTAVSKSPLWQKRLVIVLLAVMTLSLFSMVWRAGWASANYFQVQFWLYQWNANQASLTEPRYQDAYQAMSRVLSYEPEHPHYLLMMAKVQEWGWFKGFVATEQMQDVEQLYQQAIAKRPTWPVAYADYAWFLSSVQFRLTDAFAQLELAKQHGPYLDEVQQRVLAVSFSRWQHLTVPQKVVAYETLAQALKGHASLHRSTMDLVRTYRMERLGCIYLRSRAANFSEQQNARIQRDFCRAS